MSVFTAMAAGLAQAQPAAEPGFRMTSGDPSALIIERILVKVNGELFTQSDLEEAQVAELRLLPNPPQTDADLRLKIQELTPELVGRIIDELLLTQRGREMGFTLSDAQFDEIVDGIKVENGFDDEQLVAALAESEDMSLADLRTSVEERMLIQQVEQVEVNSRIVMTGTEAREYYDEHLDEFSIAATVTLREIVVGSPATGPLAAAGGAGSKATADAAHGRVTAGEDFAAVASEVSTAPSKENGGLIGPLNLSDLADGIRARVEALEVGEISEVTETPNGYQILTLEAKTETTPIPFDSVRDSIVESVAASRQAEERNDYLARLREAAIVEWKDENLKQIYEAVVAARVSTSGV
ncbi:MAG: peptidyl-prolyl cis-trans isomerase [Acidobacteria bacterium]|nr:peptidyl-prolyl cis-trans isomerase [Acidobacteriota bacterium]